MANNTTPQKTCTKCNQTFPATKEYFHKRSASKDGLTYRCKTCGKKRARQWREENPEKAAECAKQYREENKEAIAERVRQYREENKDVYTERDKQYREENKEAIAEYKRQYYEENKEAIAEYKRQYHEENKEALNERTRQYYQENKEALAEYRRQYYQENKERFRIGYSRRRARKLQLPDTFTPDEWDYCLEYFNYTCPVCNRQLRDLFGEIEPHIGHWIPLSYDGDDNPGTVATNIVCLCNSCNLSKGAKLPDEWLKDTYGTRKANEILARIEADFSSLI